MTAMPDERPRRVDPRIDRTRRLVLTATFDLIAEVGLAAATLERIAERSGVSRTTIYRRWPDRSRLYLEAFHPLEAPPVVAVTGDLRTDLREYLGRAADALNDERYAAVLLALLDRALRDTDYRDRYRDVQRRSTAPAAAVLQRAVEAGELADELDVPEALGRLLGPLVWVRLVRQEAITPAFLDSTLDGFLGQHGVAQPR